MCVSINCFHRFWTIIFNVRNNVSKSHWTLMYINGDRMLKTSDNMKAFAFILLASLLVASCVEGRLLTVINETIESVVLTVIDTNRKSGCQRNIFCMKCNVVHVAIKFIYCWMLEKCLSGYLKLYDL